MTKIAKQVLSKAILIASSSSSEIKPTKACERLSDEGFGLILGGKYIIDSQQRARLRDWLSSEHGIDWKKGVKALAGTRTNVSKHAINGKLSGHNIKRNWVKIKPLRPGNDYIVLNGQILTLQKWLHIEIDLTDIKTIELGCILIIENLETFTDICDIQINSSLPENTAVVYRGDPQTTGGIKLLKKLMKNNTNIFSVWCGDFDPAGIDMALSSKCDHLLLPALNDLDDIQGDKDDFSNQHPQLTRLLSNNESSELAHYIDYLDKRKQGFTQERMLAKQVSQQVVTL
ncbi:MAG: hypothetical protein JKY51_05675 [Opitutaceae bacterium]|nr:hypothetical protein [Opitutaceae bacterium]